MYGCSSGSNVVGPCSCGRFHTQPTSFSMLFAMSPYEEPVCPYAAASAVDCTLSLATPSTRSTGDCDRTERRSAASGFCWDFLQSSVPPPSPSQKGNRGGGGGGAAADPLLARRCANCDTTSTPLWRNGPRGPKSLCNACGIRFKKEERRATAAAAAATAGGGDATDSHHHHMLNSQPWIHQSQPTTHQKLPSFYSPSAAAAEFRFADDVDDRDSPFLSWRLNVTDRPGLVHDFTRF